MKKNKKAAAVPASEFSDQFVQGMYDRMAVSFFKYGKVADAYPDKVDAIASLKKRLDRYAETGNTEWLMDVANFAMIEFMRPRHPKAHFEGTDSHQSPGRETVAGKTSHRNNREVETAKWKGPTPLDRLFK
jgi:hypothetical protein